MVNNENFLAHKQKFAELAQHSGIAVNDTKLSELEGRRKYHRLGGKSYNN